jgi:peptidoglycan/xylan/chitin deacetylase (PgdA/CDA1 family)
MSFALCSLCALLLANDAADSADGTTSADGAAPAQAADAADSRSAPAAPIAPIPPIPPASSIAISGVTTSEPVVALTFDACATKKQANGFDRKVFEILARGQIPATFYLSGRWVERHPSAAKAIAAAPWIELGNHTYSHPRLTLMRKERIRMQIRRTNRILERKIGRPALSLRPPAGAWNAKVVKIANEEHLPVVLWSVISGDAGGHVPAARMDRAVLEQAKPGAIIIFHVNKRAPFTKKALPDIIAGLREKGFRFVTVSQLLDLPDAVPIKAKPSRFGFRPRNKPPSSEQKEQGDEHADPPT